jgi:hypothetical protein
MGTANEDDADPSVNETLHFVRGTSAEAVYLAATVLQSGHPTQSAFRVDRKLNWSQADSIGELDHPEIINLNQNELSETVEATLNDAGVNNSSESWGETATRIEDDNPMLAAWLREAEAKWFEFES